MCKFKQIVLSIFCYIFVNSCGDSSIFTSVYIFPHNIWHVDQKPCFEFVIPTVDQPYDCMIQLTNTVYYPYANLYMNCCLEGEDIIKNDRFELQLFDRKTGRPLGTGWRCKQHDYYLMANYSFKKPGTYKVQLAHAMRQDTLEGIEKIVFIIKPARLK